MTVYVLIHLICLNYWPHTLLRQTRQMLMEGLKASGCLDIFKSDYLKRLLALAKSFPSLYYSNLNIVM